MHQSKGALVEAPMVPATVLRYGGRTDGLTLESLAGGQGWTLKVLLGALPVLFVGNGLRLVQIGASTLTMARGAILVLAKALARR